MLSQHKGWNYFQVEGTKLQEKRAPRELEYLSKKL